MYKEPAENSRRKLSEKYRHVSSNGASDGSISANGGDSSGHKIEKRKASVTMLKSRTDSANEQELAAAKTHSESSDGDEGSQETKSNESEEPTEEPVLAKKQPSPTKIKQPVAGLKPELTSEEIISPVLQVVCQTPERSQKHLYKYVEGMSATRP